MTDPDLIYSGNGIVITKRLLRVGRETYSLELVESLQATVAPNRLMNLAKIFLAAGIVGLVVRFGYPFTQGTDPLNWNNQLDHWLINAAILTGIPIGAILAVIFRDKHVLTVSGSMGDVVVYKTTNERTFNKVKGALELVLSKTPPALPKPSTS